MAVDIVPEKVELINSKKSPIQDEYIEKYLTEKELNLTATLDAKEAYSDADFVVIAGSSGVLITDTIMFLVFLTAAIIGIPFIVKAAGGWIPAIQNLALSTTKPGIISAGGNLEYLYPTGAENITWAVTYGIVWALVVMISPWQTSRYLMAKDEKTVLKSAVWSSALVIMITTLLYFSAAFVQSINPDLVASQSIIWAAMNLMPKLVGVVLLTGILAAGISSASTFLSLIGFSITNDLMNLKGGEVDKQLRISRVGMIGASVLVLILAYFNPPQIFWIMYFGGTVIASSWAVVALGSVWSKKLSSMGAFLGMLLGFVGCVGVKSYSVMMSVTLPIWADSFFIGILLSIIGAAVGSIVWPKSDAEQKEQNQLKTEVESVDGIHKYGIAYLGFAVAFTLFMLCMYVSSSDYIRDMRINEKLGTLLTLLMEQSWHPESMTVSRKRLELAAVKEYLDEHFTEKIVLEELAEKFFINKFYLSKIFKETYGTTINNYLISKRITRAKQLLRFTDMTVDEIGVAVGMADANYFSRMFRKVEGSSPREYRKQW